MEFSTCPKFDPDPSLIYVLVPSGTERSLNLLTGLKQSSPWDKVWEFIVYTTLEAVGGPVYDLDDSNGLNGDD